MSEIVRHERFTGVDSWEGELTYQGTTYLVEVQERTGRGESVWDMEVLRQTGRFGVDPLHGSRHPSLETALQAAEAYIRARHAPPDG